MAPEQFAGDPSADHRMDLYALGVLAYEMLTGQPPFTGATPSALARAHLSTAPTPVRSRRGDVPPALEALVARLMEKDPAARPATATEVLRALRSPTLLSTDEDGTPRVARQQSRGRLAGATRDLLHAWRTLRRAPLLFAAAVICLALGIAVTTTVFGVADVALLRPVPFADADRLLSVFRTAGALGGDNPHSTPNFLDLAEDPQMEGMAAFATGSRLVDLGGRTEPAYTVRVTGRFFPLLRANAHLGRLLTPDDDVEGAAPVVVVGYDYWRSQLGGSRGIVGTTLRVDGIAHEVVGVLPPRFRMYNGGTSYAGEIWVPIHFSTADRAARTSNYLRVFGRLAPGASVSTAEQSLVARFARVVETFPELKGYGITVRPLIADAGVQIRTPLLLLIAASAAVLAIAGINVSSLLLARGIRRQNELAVRGAIGATRWEVMRPVLAEGAIIAVVGWMLGVMLAALLTRTVVALGAQRLEQLSDVRLDPRALGVGLLLACVAAAVGSLAPALRASRVQPADALRGGRAAGTRTQHRTLATLVVIEGMLAVTLLIASGLVFKGFLRLAGNDPGLDPSRLLTLRVRVAPTDYADDRAAITFLTPALEAVERVPGVRAAGAISQMPYMEWGWNAWIRYDGQAELPLAERPLIETRNITPGFFAATGQRLLAGRLPDERESARDGGPPRVVVNASLVQRDFPDRDPIGQRFHLGGQAMEIIGVVSDVRNFGPIAPPRPEAYWTFAQRHPAAVGYIFAVATDRDDPAMVAADVERVLREVNPRVAVSQVRPMRQVIAESIGWPRFMFALFATLASVALLLSVAGFFGILSYAVEQQRREFGLRAALGAPPARLAREVMRRGASMLAVAMALGVGVAWAVTRLMASVIYGVDPLDPLVWGGALAAMAIAGLTAAAAPAWRASRVSPLVAMQHE
jgi:predicted permease